MAALVLSTADAAGNTVLGRRHRRASGRRSRGYVIDRALFGGRCDITLDCPRLSDVTVMASTEGAPIPRVMLC